MVAHPGAPLGAGDLRCVVERRPLRAPAPLEVRADADGEPIAVRRRGWPAVRRVVRVQDRWRVDDEWWRETPIARIYQTVILDDGAVLTLYRSLDDGRWLEQRY